MRESSPQLGNFLVLLEGCRLSNKSKCRISRKRYWKEQKEPKSKRHARHWRHKG
ncbi:hypothetical protein Goklo_023192 [Gossypium klotzschianum]|uniref:Uncharacterized protein n=1 Tax=Gossypium klotzschianum TaxID=34286 RepID=A0A7J8TPS4_9ROSI|nr:hypothetical protein [Gossypium klotzschianum]